MLHTFVKKFDVMGSVENFLETNQGIKVSRVWRKGRLADFHKN